MKSAHPHPEAKALRQCTVAGGCYCAKSELPPGQRINLYACAKRYKSAVRQIIDDRIWGKASPE